MSAVFLLLGGSKQENKSKQERGRRDTTLMRDFQSSFAEIARLLSEFFRDLDVVPSDVLAGLILLRQRQQAARQQIISQVSIRLNTSYWVSRGVTGCHGMSLGVTRSDCQTNTNKSLARQGLLSFPIREDP